MNTRLRKPEARLGDIDLKSEVVAYRRGRYCVPASGAVVHLRQRGFKAYRLEDGLPE